MFHLLVPNYFPDSRYKYFKRDIFSHLQCVLQRFIPRMPCQSIFRMMHRQNTLRPQIHRDLFQVIRHHMNILPIFIILPVLDDRKINTRETLANLGEMRVIPPITTYIYLPRGTLPRSDAQANNERQNHHPARSLQTNPIPRYVPCQIPNTRNVPRLPIRI